jgi:hypothetical protein
MALLVPREVFVGDTMAPRCPLSCPALLGEEVLRDIEANRLLIPASVARVLRNRARRGRRMRGRRWPGRRAFDRRRAVHRRDQLTVEIACGVTGITFK